jgi:hypothetical protein
MGEGGLRLRIAALWFVRATLPCLSGRDVGTSDSFLWRCGPTRARVPSFMRFVDHIRHTPVGRTPLDE